MAKILVSANKDLKIAEKSKEIEVTFKFYYDAFLKFCIYIVAQEGYKVPCYYQKIIEQTTKILKDELIDSIEMNLKRKEILIFMNIYSWFWIKIQKSILNLLKNYSLNIFFKISIKY